jgi:hypothetical protein
MHPEALDFCRQHATSGWGQGLEIGGRDLNGNARDLWPNVEWWVLDVLAGPGIDIVADARTWTPDRSYDVVLCTEVLEHVEDWHLIISTAAKALTAGGHLVLTCAGLGRPPHSGLEATEIQPGEYYRNIGSIELRGALEGAGLTVEICRQSGYDTQAVAVA